MLSVFQTARDHAVGTPPPVTPPPVTLVRAAFLMPALLALVVAGGGLTLSAREASAATLVYRTDAQLVALSERVVHGRVLDVHTEWAPGRRTIYTVARVAVLEDLTGLTDPVIEVRELGGVLDGVQMWVPGTPRFVPGQELVLLLERIDRRWRTVAMEFSTFQVSPQPDGDAALTRQAAESIVVGAPAVDSRTRRLSDLRATVAAVKGARPVRPGGERFVREQELADAAAAAAAEQAGTRVSAPFTLLFDMRWRQADSDMPVPWFRDPSAPAPMTGGGSVDAQIQTAVAAWTNPPTSRVVLTFNGERAVFGWTTPGTCPPVSDGGLITFEDPFNEVNGSVIALGGGCSSADPDHVASGHQFRSMTTGFVIFNNASELSPGIRSPQNFLRVLTHEIGHGIGLGHTCEGAGCTLAMQVNLMYPSCCSGSTPNPPAIGPDDLAAIEFIYPMPAGPQPPPDTDGDGMPNQWESDYGLDPNMPDSTADPDGDGLTNLQEYQQTSHPRGFEKRFFAEGVVNAFFETQIALLNPTGGEAKVLLRLQPQAGAEKSVRVAVPAGSRRTVTNATLGGLASEPFSTLVESDVAVVADRTVSWGTGAYGSHTETALLKPATTWYLAEGATGGGFDVYYLIQNPNTSAVQVDVTYLLPFGAPLVKRYGVAAKSRLTIWVDDESIPPSLDKVLAATDVSAKVQVVAGGGPVIVERAMYYTVPGGPLYGAGHESAGVSGEQFEAEGTTWFFAEGATGSFFDTYVLLSNPGTGVAHVTATYLLTSGQTFTKTYTLAPQSRFTIWVDEEQIPAGSGIKPLASVDVSTTLTSDVPIIAERSMWWPQGGWYEAHNTAGATSFGTKWAIAEGEAGGARNAQTFLLIANVGSQPADIRVTLMTEGGTTIVWPAAGSNHTLPAHSRFTVPIDTTRFPGVTNQRFGAIVDSLNGQPIVVERANYYNVSSALWASGGAALASKLASP